MFRANEAPSLPVEDLKLVERSVQGVDLDVKIAGRCYGLEVETREGGSIVVYPLLRRGDALPARAIFAA